jgi:hypothetical protein
VADDWAVRQMMWQHGRVTSGSTAGDMAHTWVNQALTHVQFSLVEKGATWPNTGLPRGTPLLVIGLYV